MGAPTFSGFLIIETLPDGQEHVLESRSHLAPIVYLQTGQAPR
jgi:hypothetical protein